LTKPHILVEYLARGECTDMPTQKDSFHCVGDGMFRTGSGDAGSDVADQASWVAPAIEAQMVRASVEKYGSAIPKSQRKAELQRTINHWEGRVLGTIEALKRYRGANINCGPARQLRAELEEANREVAQRKAQLERLG
jgi:hypothetical protein